MLLKIFQIELLHFR